jgi:hypothetical protein
MLGYSPPERPERTARVMRRLVVLGSVYPFALLASMYHMWIAGRYALGWWPRPSLDDPKDITGAWYELASAVFGLLFAGALPAMAGTMAFGVLALTEMPSSAPRRPADVVRFVVVPIVIWAAAVAVVHWDPARVLYWYMD